MSSISSTKQSCPDASYEGAQDWLTCFERLGHGGLSPDQAIHQATQEIGSSGLLLWTMPLALGLWMRNRHSEALEALLGPGVEQACGHIAHFHTLIGMVARHAAGKHQLACQVYENALKIENQIAMTLFIILRI